MMELIILTLGILIGWKLGTTVQLFSFKRVLEELGVKNAQLRDLAKRNGIDLPEEPQESKPDLTVIEVRVEEINGIYYVYRKKDDQFLCQGIDKQQLIDGIHNRMGNCRVVIDKDEGANLFKA
jgi:hypothetical protein